VTGFCIGIDVGGTFTDVVVADGDGRLTIAKAASTPADQSLGVLEGVRLAAERLGMTLAGLLARTERIVHGTTVGTNALLERKGARLGMLTTAGHRDVVEMREGLKEDRYNLRLAPPQPLAPRRLRLGVRERVRPDGRVELKLDAKSLAQAIAALKREKVEAIAICYLHAWRNPRHETETARALRKALPGVYVSLSSDVLPQIKEYERFSTTLVNAYVGPALDRYLSRLESRLTEAGFRGPVFVILSHGGVTPIAEAIRLAAGTVLSGPAGGVAGARECARMLGTGNLIPFDMGGTSTDISLIIDGRPTLSAGRGIAGERIALPSLDIVSLGAGGGSIAQVDAGGLLHVGPESAGAEPGPACYGRGGTRATVTDANVVLGYLDLARFLGGRTLLDEAAADTAVDAIARALKCSRVEAASGIYRVINTKMAEGIRLVSVRRGVDPRRFALLAFGGAAGLHVSAVARQLDLTRVIVPTVASVLSAWGMLATDLRFEAARTHIGDGRAPSAASVRRTFAALEAQGRKRLAGWFDGPIRVQRAADMRYGEQIFEIDVPLDDVAWDRDDLRAQIEERFHRRHEALFTYALRDQEAVIVNAHVGVTGELPAPKRPAVRTQGGAARPHTHRRVWFGAWRAVPLYEAEALGAGQAIDGPALIVAETTTVLLQDGDRATVTEQGWLDVAIGGAAAAEMT
jgi:N-methylhydantoinase A